MIKTTRRKFLKFMGASPLVARKAAAEMAQMESAGFRVLGGEESHSGPMAMSVGGEDTDHLLNVLKRFGLPDWKKQEIKEQAKYITRLNPNIAALHSVSMSSKIRMQRELNEKELEQNIYNYLKREGLRQSFSKFHNVYRYF